MIKKLYNISIPKVGPGNVQVTLHFLSFFLFALPPDVLARSYSFPCEKAVVSFLEQYYSPRDLLQFQKLYQTPVLPIEQTYGPNEATKPGIEASLDVQYLTGVTGTGQGYWGNHALSALFFPSLPSA